MRGLTRWRPWATLSLALTVIAAASLLGSVRSSWELLTGAGGGSGLDYVAASGTINALTEEFISQQLGPGSSSTADGEAPLGFNGPMGGTTATEPMATTAPRPIPVLVDHAPSNDSFAKAYDVPSIPFRARTEPSNAGRERNEPDSCARTGPTVWYQWTSDQTRGVTASAAADGTASALGVFVGDDVGDLEPLACDSVVAGDAGIRFPTEAGTTYHFQVAAPLGAESIEFLLDEMGTTSRMMARNGEQLSGDYTALEPILSATGRFVVFETYDSNLVEGDDNGTFDVFLHDREAGTTALVSVAMDGAMANGASGAIQNTVSADGRFVGFASRATNLVPGDTNDQWDYFVRDMHQNTTVRVSVHSDGSQGRTQGVETGQEAGRRASCENFDGERGPDSGVVNECRWIRYMDMTPDGRYVVFWSELRGLADEPGGEGPADLDQRDAAAVYRHDLVTRETVQVFEPDRPWNYADMPAISDDGTRIVYRAESNDLEGEDSHPVNPPGQGVLYAVVNDLEAGWSKVVSVSSDGTPADAFIYPPDISGDGRFVVFTSNATNLVPDDTNEINDVFVHDLDTGETIRVSVNTQGEQQVLDSRPENAAYFNQPTVSISFDGRFVAFGSIASNLAPESSDAQEPGCSAHDQDAFVRDLRAGTTTLVSVANHGATANRCVRGVQVSDDGNAVTFFSRADNLVEDDTNRDVAAGGLASGWDVFFHDFRTPT